MQTKEDQSFLEKKIAMTNFPDNSLAWIKWPKFPDFFFQNSLIIQ